MHDRLQAASADPSWGDIQNAWLQSAGGGDLHEPNQGKNLQSARRLCSDFVSGSVPSRARSVSRHRVCTKRVSLLAWSLLSLCGTSHGAEWYAQPTARGSVEYDDNRRLNPDEPEAELTERISPELLFGMRTPPLAIAGAVRADIGRSSDKELDRTDLFSRLVTVYEDELNSWGLIFDWRRESLLRTLIISATEVEVPGQDAEPDAPLPDPDDVSDEGDPALGDQERRETDVQRDRFRVSPIYRRALTERTVLELGHQFTSVVFEDIDTGDGSTLEDSTSHKIFGGLDFSLTPTYTLVGRVEYDRFDADTSSFDQVGVLGGVNHAFSQTFQGEVRAGFKHMSFSSDDDASGEDTNFVYNAVAVKQLPTGRAIAILQRDIQGGGSGNARALDQLDVQWDMEVVPQRGRFSFVGRVFRIENVDLGVPEAETETERVYFQLQPRFSWRFHPQLSVDISYRFRLNDPEGQDAAHSNAAIVGINYSFQRQSLSR